jgi:hypothetical protein
VIILEQIHLSEDIHLSVADADDIEEIIDEEISVFDVFSNLVQHPAQVITRWNWKAALLGAILRASFYFTVYRASKENWVVTLTAMLVEFVFRFVTSGVSGALIQSFRRANPAWLATAIVTVSLPVFSHSVEFITHYAQEKYFANVFAAAENDARTKAFAISVMFSVLSAMFNIFAMRHGVLLVGAGEETKSLGSDLKKIPRLIAEFVSFLPIQMLKFLRSGDFIYSVGIFLAFGLTVGFILGTFRGKWSWAWTTALGAWAIMFVWTIIVAIILHFMKKSANEKNY